MILNVRIDEMQEVTYVAPIFQSLRAQNVSNAVMEQLYFDVALSQYFDYLPQSLKTDPAFIKKCLEHNLIHVDNVPNELRNTTFISKELYLQMLSHSHHFLTFNLYKKEDNFDIALSAIKQDAMAYRYINQDENIKHLLDDPDFIAQALLVNYSFFNWMKPEQQKEILQNKAYLVKLLKTAPEAWDYLNDEKQNDPEILKSMLQTVKGFYKCKDSLRRSKDEEVAIIALGYGDEVRKMLHQKFSSLFKQHKVKENCQQFLKIYLSQQNLTQKLNNDKPIVQRAKI